jgi:glycosyltransferase involved in cell wall biosynthesis
MKIALIGPGLMPIPPVSWGAVEILMWNYYVHLSNKGHDVEIYNTQDLSSVKKDIQTKKFDVVHLHFDNYLNFFEDLDCNKFFVTSHYGNLPKEENYENFYWNIFYSFLKTKHKIIALSPEIKQKYVSYGFDKTRIDVCYNGVEVDSFNFTDKPTLKDRTIYFGRLEKRKRQNLYSNIDNLNLDFVGNAGDLTDFKVSNGNKYLGAWDKARVYSDLTQYANLALLSSGEAHPLVCMEALSAGLGLVISEVASANLDVNKEFITVIPENKIEDMRYIKSCINENRELSLNMREEIRQYAKDNFSWDVVTNKYIDLIRS